MFDIGSLNHDNRVWYFQIGENRYYNDVAAFMAWCRDRSQKLEFVWGYAPLYPTLGAPEWCPYHASRSTP